eukprot:2818097-Amphidinium_carterae.2
MTVGERATEFKYAPQPSCCKHYSEHPVVVENSKTPQNNGTKGSRTFRFAGSMFVHAVSLDSVLHT